MVKKTRTPHFFDVDTARISGKTTRHITYKY